MIATLSVLSLIGLLLAWAYISDSHSRKAEEEKAQLKKSNWLKEQNDLPKWRVTVKTKSGKVYFTDYFDPKSEILDWGSFGLSVCSRSSLDNAESFIAGCFELNRYYHKNTHTFVPMCEIENIKAEAENI